MLEREKEVIVATNNLLASSSIVKSEQFSTTEPTNGGTFSNRNYNLNIKNILYKL